MCMVYIGLYLWNKLQQNICSTKSTNSFNYIKNTYMYHCISLITIYINNVKHLLMYSTAVIPYFIINGYIYFFV